MPSGLGARIKSKLSLQRRSSTSGVSTGSSTSRLAVDEADTASSRSSSVRRRHPLQPGQSQAGPTRRPVSNIESSTSSGRETGATPASGSPDNDTTGARCSPPSAPLAGIFVQQRDAKTVGKPRPKSTLGLMSTGDGAEPSASAGAQASSQDNAQLQPVDRQDSTVATAGVGIDKNSPACPSAQLQTLSTPASPDSGPHSAPPAPSSSAACSSSPDSGILHLQRRELQHRLKRLSQDPLYYDPALLPSPSARDKNSPGTCAASPTLERIFEHFSTEPFRKLRPPERFPGEHGNPYTDPRLHPLHGHASSSSAPANAASPSTATRNRTKPSSSAAAEYTSSTSSESSSGSSAAPRRSSGSGPAIRQVKTPRTAHFVLDPAPEFALPSPPAMAGARKIWVRRPGASPTLITIAEDDLVDDVRDIILRKYANSLGKTFDAPDLHLRLYPRDQKDRLLQPDEHMCRTLENFYPGGQTVDDAIVIDIPRRTPKASPHPSQHGHHHYAQHQIPHTAATIYYTEDGRPLESGEGYFPPVGALPSPHMQLVMPASDRHGGQPHSIAVLGTGHLPTIPSPGGLRPRGHREQSGRPRVGRTQTSSSGINGSHGNSHSHGMHQLRPRLAHSRTHSSSSDPSGMPPGVVPISHSSMPKSPGLDHMHHSARVGTPPARMIEPRSSSARPKRRQKNADFAGANGGVVATVPPISVLIVEDNPINLKLLEAFVKRLKVRWQTATNGRDAVKKWRTGGFHLVLMDIQLPVMNGLEATREIRRLEQVNSIGVFSSVPTTPQEELVLELQDKDRLDNLHLFKGPVIIVALTASSLQSDRHEALAAGCNDFLTKPVNFVWLERKVMEWGCMQALIDFDGWRTWKDFALAEEEANQKTAAARSKAKKSRSSLATEV